MGSRGGYGSSVAPSSRSRSGTLRAYGPPFWADRMFWIALALAVGVGSLLVVVLLMLLAVPRTTIGWVWTIGLGLVTAWIALTVLSIGLHTARGAEQGMAEADSARGERYEEHGRRAGRVVGRGLAAVTGRSSTGSTVSTDPAVAADGATADDEHPGSDDAPTSRTRTDLDRGANSLGRMVGRRLAERRDRTEEDA